MSINTMNGGIKIDCYAAGDRAFMLWGQSLRAYLLQPLLYWLNKLGCTPNYLSYLYIYLCHSYRILHGAKFHGYSLYLAHQAALYNLRLAGGGMLLSSKFIELPGMGVQSATAVESTDRFSAN